MGHSYEKYGVSALALTIDNKYAIYASGDNVIRILSIADKKLFKTCIGHDDRITNLAVTPDGRLLVSSCEDKTIRVWDCRTGTIQRSFEFAGKVDCFALASDGIIVAAVTEGLSLGALIVTDLNSGKNLCHIPNEGFWVTDMVISKDSRYAFTSSSLPRVIIAWDLNTGRQTQVFYNDKGSRKVAVAIAPDGHHVISGGDCGDVTYWDVEKENPDFYLLHHEVDVSQPNYWQYPGQFVHNVAFFNSGQKIMSSARDGTVKLWDVKDRTLKSFTDLKTTLTVCKISQDGRNIVAGDEAGKIYFLTPEDFVPGLT